MQATPPRPAKGNQIKNSARWPVLVRVGCGYIASCFQRLGINNSITVKPLGKGEIRPLSK